MAQQLTFDPSDEGPSQEQKDAEAQADQRQELAMGGTPLSEEEKMLEEIETSDSKRVARKISDNMMDPYTQDRYVRS